jgi:hypothetical protein
VIRIRYKDFSAGTHDATWLHGRAERCPRGVTVYLVPGLTACQRRAVLRRLRQEASRGFGPALPLPQLAVAIGLDRLRTAARVAGAAIRLHPAVTLVPGAFAVALMALFVLASAGGSGITPAPPGSLAQAAAVGQTRAPGADRAGRRLVRVTAAAGGVGLGSGQRAQQKTGHSADWYVRPQTTISPVPRPRLPGPRLPGPRLPAPRRGQPALCGNGRGAAACRSRGRARVSATAAEARARRKPPSRPRPGT